MTPPKGWSLERGLSVRLAVQTVLGMAIVSSVIYVTTAIHLNSRQLNMLESQVEVVKHVFSEVQQGNEDQETLLHRLKDYFAGHPDVGLVLTSAALGKIYQTPHPEPAGGSRTAEFLVSMPAGSQGDVTARLSLDLRADERLLP